MYVMVLWKFVILDFQELENGILTSCTTEGSDLLNQLIAALLAGYYNSKSIQ